MPLQGKGKFSTESRSKSGRIQVPAALVKDSQFPLSEGPVIIEIVDGKLVISSARVPC